MCSNFQGKLIIISAPSGAGKSTLVQHVIQEIPSLAFSVSCTTRAKREYEVDGEHYHFISIEEFQEKIRQNAFIEWEQVYEGLYYGTLKSEISEHFAQQKHVIFDIDVQGGINIKKQHPEALSIFISPPSIEELERRLINRNTENEETLQKRISKAETEMQFASSFDYILVNDTLVEAQKSLKIKLLQFLQT